MRNREGLQETPTRIAKMYQEIFAGLGQTAEEHLSKSFEIIDNNMVVEKDIFFHSMCEHHFFTILWKSAHCLHSKWPCGWAFKTGSYGRGLR